VSSLCLAHHAVRLWSSPTRWPRGATNHVQIRWRCAHFLPSIQVRWPSFDKTESLSKDAQVCFTSLTGNILLWCQSWPGCSWCCCIFVSKGRGWIFPWKLSELSWSFRAHLRVTLRGHAVSLRSPCSSQVCTMMQPKYFLSPDRRLVSLNLCNRWCFYVYVHSLIKHISALMKTIKTTAKYYNTLQRTAIHCNTSYHINEMKPIKPENTRITNHTV